MRGLLLPALLTTAVSTSALAAPAMLLEVWMAGQKGDIIEVVPEDGHLYISQADFAALHLSLAARPQGGRVDLTHLPGLKVTVDQANQKLELDVATAALPQQSFDLKPEPGSNDEAVSGTGAILHYSLSGTDNDVRMPGHTATGGGEFTLDGFTPWGLFHNSGFVTADDMGWHGARMDSTLLFDHPDSMTHLSLGDAISVTPDWGRSVRFGGIEYASDFALRPGLVTQPLPSFFGQSAVPATVDVFNGAVQVYQQQVNPGPFALHNLPVVTGGGTATIVTTDVLGRQTSQTIALFSDSGMLAPGLQSFALDAGFLRGEYGLQSFDYRTAIASGNWRRGLTDYLTVEGHGEASPGLGLVGGGGEFGFGVGTLSADVAASHSKAGDGSLASLSGQVMHGPVSFYAKAMFASVDYRDVASQDGGVAPPRDRYQLGLNIDLKPMFGPIGRLGMSWLDDRNPGQPTQRYFTASWSVDLPNGMFMSLTGLDDVINHRLGAQFALSMPLGDEDMAGAAANAGNGKTTADLIYNHPASPDGGFGWRGLVGNENDGRFNAGATYIGQQTALDGSIASQSGQTGIQANADGALVLLRGSIYATHNPGNAVALVEAGQPNVHVFLENRPIGISDANGNVLVTGLNPYAPNHISVEPRDYPFDTPVEKTEMVVTPRQHSGALANLAPARHHTITVEVTMGTWAPPVGARVLLDGENASLVMGRGGKFQLDAVDAARGATVEAGNMRCRINIAPANDSPLLCLREARVASAY